MDPYRVIRYKVDIDVIREKTPILVHHTDGEICQLYGDFSEEWWAAGWITLDENKLNDFHAWLAANRK